MRSLFLLSSLFTALAKPMVLPEHGFEQAFLSPASHSSPADAQDAIYVGQDSSNVDPMARPSWFTSVLMARRLLALSTSGVASTIFPSSFPPTSHTPPALAGQSISLPEYIADCNEVLPSVADDGNPTLLALNIATTFRNTAAGSNISLAIDWWSHLDDADPVYPGFPRSPAGLPRLTLFGYVEPFRDPEPRKELEGCFLSKHPDAKAWLPGKKDSPHSSYWARFVVTNAYWIGGFGDVQQIGWVNVTEWAGIRRSGSVEGVGDGRGWEDVRLPGEQ